MAQWLERAGSVASDVARIDADREAVVQHAGSWVPALRPIKDSGPDASCLAPGPGKKVGSRMLQHYAVNMSKK